jgi:hypothetical protein
MRPMSTQKIKGQGISKGRSLKIPNTVLTLPCCESLPPALSLIMSMATSSMMRRCEFKVFEILVGIQSPNLSIHSGIYGSSESMRTEALDGSTTTALKGYVNAASLVSIELDHEQEITVVLRKRASRATQSVKVVLNGSFADYKTLARLNETESLTNHDQCYQA